MTESLCVAAIVVGSVALFLRALTAVGLAAERARASVATAELKAWLAPRIVIEPRSGEETPCRPLPRI